LEKDGYPVAAILSVPELEDFLDAKELESLEKSATGFASLSSVKKKYGV